MKNQAKKIVTKTIEVEDYNGNTIMAFEINEKLEITKFLRCEIADRDGDDIFGTGDEKIRIQSTVK